MAKILFTNLMMIFLLLYSNISITNASELPVEIKSDAAVLIDSETGAVLYEKNGEKTLYPASLTKIATAIYAIENGRLEDEVIVSANAIKEEGTRVYLVEGEKVPLKKLIQGMLINSGNDAAVAIAEHLDGTVEKFSENINQYLQNKIGVKNTHFTNPNGLFHENHYTTAMDLALITNYALKNPVFSEIFATKQLEWIGESWKTTLITHHRLLKGEFPYEGITGGKTGFVNESRHTLATTAAKGDLKLTAIVLKSETNNDTYSDTQTLLDFGFQNFRHMIIQQTERFLKGEKEFSPAENITITVPQNEMKLDISKNGVLSVEMGGNKLQMVQLKEKVKEEKVVEEVNEEVITETQQEREQNTNTFYSFGFGLLAAAGLIMGARKKLGKKNRNKGL